MMSWYDDMLNSCKALEQIKEKGRGWNIWKYILNKTGTDPVCVLVRQSIPGKTVVKNGKRLLGPAPDY